MSEDQSNNGSGKKTWVEKIGAAFSHHPRNREEVLEVLYAASEQGILDDDALAMMEGAIEMLSHKGYGTEEHLECLARYGPCPIHRQTFAPVEAISRIGVVPHVPAVEALQSWEQ